MSNLANDAIWITRKHLDNSKTMYENRFLVFGYPGGTLALVVHILRQEADKVTSN
jgi:uncharacterized DUF497 family protein